MAAPPSSAVCNVQAGAGAAELGASAVTVQSQRPPLSAVLEAVQSQVPQSAERDRVVDAVRQLLSGVNQKGVRLLAGQWDVRQKFSGDNRGTPDIRNEVEANVRRAAMALLQKQEVPEEGAGVIAREDVATGSDAVVLTEPTTDASSARSSRHKLAESVGKRVAVAGCTPGKSEMARHGKKRRMPEATAADKSVAEAPDHVSLSLQAQPVIEAIAILGTLSAGERVDELRHLLLQWRAGASVQGNTRDYFRKVAAQFRIPLPGNTCRETPRILRAIAEVFKARVSAARIWGPGAGTGVSAAASARGSGAGEPACRGVGEPACAVPGAPPDGAPMGKRKAKGPAGEDSCAEEPIGEASGAAGSNAVAGVGIAPQRSSRRRKREATACEAAGEGSGAREPIAPGAGGAPALAGGVSSAS